MRAEHFNVLWLSEHFVNYRRLLSFSTLDSKWFWLIVGFILPSLTVTKSRKHWNPVAAFQCQGLIPWQPHVISYHYWDCQDNLGSVTGCQKKWCNYCNKTINFRKKILWNWQISSFFILFLKKMRIYYIKLCSFFMRNLIVA